MTKQILSFTYPEKIKMRYYNRRKYRISVKYTDEDKKLRFKTIYFGCHGFPNLVDDGVLHSRRIESTDIFTPQFWEK
jgi:hypothetical protein